MLSIILKDIKSMLKRPVVFILLFLGIVAGSFSLCTYYTMNTRTAALESKIAGENTVIESSIRISSEAEEIYGAIKSFDNSNELPPLNYASVIGYDSSNYDVVGLYYPQENTDLFKGQFLGKEDIGQSVAVVSADAFEEEPEIGEKIRISGANYYTVKGIFEKGYYDPFTYDMRRLSEGSEYLAGEDVDNNAWYEEIKDRPDAAVIIPIDKFIENQITPSYFHIQFANELSEAQMQSVKDYLTEYCGVNEFTDTTALINVTDTNKTSNTVAYIAAVFCGIINIVVLFAFFLKENRKQYITYKILGATNGRIAAIIVFELAIYTLIAYIIGAAGAYPFIEYSGYVSIHLDMGLWDHLLVFGVLFLLELVICFGQIRALTGKSVIALRQGSKKEKAADNELSLSNKCLYLLSFQYNKKNIIRTLALCVLAAVSAFCFAYSYTYVFESGALTRYTNKVFPNGAAAILPYYEAQMEIFTRANSVDENNYYLGIKNDPYIDDVEKKLAPFSENIGIIKGFKAAWLDNAEGEGNNDIYQVNNIFAQNEPIPLKKGSWLAFTDYDKTDENAVIPCIILPSLASKYPYNTEFTQKVKVITALVKSDDGGGYSEFVEVERKYKVVGVVDEDAYLLNQLDNCVGTQESVNLFLNKIDTELNAHIYTPELLFAGEEAYSVFYDIPAYYIFYNNDGTPNEIDIRTAVSDFGVVYNFKPIIENYVESFKEAGGNVYFVHAFIATALLLLGVGGYSVMQFASNRYTYGIYYSLGMPWNKIISLILSSNAINMLLPAVFGSVFGVILAGQIRVFDTATKVYSALMGIAIVLAVYIISALFIYLLVRKAHPKNLLENGGV